LRTFRNKILLGYSPSLLLVLLVLVWSGISLLRLGRSSESILRENYRSIMAAEHMIDAIERQDSSMLLMLPGQRINKNQPDMKSYMQFRGGNEH